MLLGEAFVKIQADLSPLKKGLEKARGMMHKFNQDLAKSVVKGLGPFGIIVGGLMDVVGILTSVLTGLFSILKTIASTIISIVIKAFKLLISVIKTVISFVLRLTTTIVALIAVIDTLVIGLAAVSVKAFASFEQGMMNVQSVIQDSQKILMSLAEAAKDFGEKFAFSATEAADAMYFLGSAGYNAVQIMNTFPATLKLAAATQANLAIVTETVVNNINAFGLSTAEADRIANVFAATIASSQATLEKLRVSMGYAAPIARALGISVETTAAAMGILYNRGLEASMAGTGLRMSMTRLAAPTRSAYKILKQLGLTAEDVNPELHGLADILDTLQDAGAGLAEISGMIGVRAGTTFLNLISAGGDELRRFTAEITGTNKATLMAAIQLDTLSGTMRKLWIHVKNVGIAIGSKLAPYIRNMTEYVGELLNRLEDWIGGAKDPFRPMMETFAELITKAAPFFDMMIQWMISLIKWITQLHYVIIKAIGAVLERAPQILDVMKTLFTDIFNSVKNLLSAALRAIKEFFKKLVPVLYRSIMKITQVIAILLMTAGFEKEGMKLLDVVGNVLTGLYKIVYNFDTTISTIFENTSDNVKKLVDEIKKLGIELGAISGDPALKKIGEYFEDLAKKATGATADIIKGLAKTLLMGRGGAATKILKEDLKKLREHPVEPPMFPETKREEEWQKKRLDFEEQMKGLHKGEVKQLEESRKRKLKAQEEEKKWFKIANDLWDYKTTKNKKWMTEEERQRAYVAVSKGRAAKESIKLEDQFTKDIIKIHDKEVSKAQEGWDIAKKEEDKWAKSRKRRTEAWAAEEKLPWRKRIRERQRMGGAEIERRERSHLEDLYKKAEKYRQKLYKSLVSPETSIAYKTAEQRVETLRKQIAKIRTPEERMPRTWQYMTKARKQEQDLKAYQDKVKTLLGQIADNTGAGFGLTQ